MTKSSRSWRVGPRAAALGIFLLAGLVLAASGPAAFAAKKKVGVSVTGMPAGPVRGAITDVVKKHGFEAVSPDLSSDSDDAIASAARQAHLAAVIVGEVREGGKRLKLRVYGASGELIGEGSWTEKGGVKKLAAGVERTLWARVGSALSKAHAGAAERPARAERQQQPEAEAEPEPSRAAPVEETPTYSRSKESDAPREAAEESEPPRKRKKKRSVSSDEAEAVASEKGGGAEGPADTALDLAVGPRFVTRSLTWQQSGAALNPYSLGFAPAIGASLAWFPAAHVTGGWASNIGLALSAEYVPGLSSQTNDGAKYPTSASDYWGGVRGRLQLGPVSGALTLGGGQQAVIFHSQGTSMRANLSGTPDVRYTYARAGLDLRVALPSNLALVLGGGVRKVLSSGDQNYLLQAMPFLPNASVLGFDVAAALGYRFMPLLEARLGFDLRRYQITPGANGLMTTGGTDQYTAITLGLAVLLDGAGQQGGGGARRGSSDDGDGDGDGEAPPPRPEKKAKEPDEDEE